mmetsp:Transcript_10062/g.46092  ORF Transcript_10062/g.46092 Transcript_10062/m.46092 type:complete len:243 (-) Transcript_10062:1730-2458(-)
MMLHSPALYVRLSTTFATTSMALSATSPIAPTASPATSPTDPRHGPRHPATGSQIEPHASPHTPRSMSGISMPDGRLMPPRTLPRSPIPPAAFARDAPTLPKSAPASAPRTMIPAAPPTAYFAIFIAPPFFLAAATSPAFLGSTSKAQSLVCGHGTPYCKESATTSLSADLLFVSHATAVSMSMRSLMKTLSNGMFRLLFSRSGATGMVLSHTSPPASRPLMDMLGGRPPWILPATMTGAPM